MLMLQIVYHFNYLPVGSTFSKEQGRLEQKLFDNRIFAARGTLLLLQMVLTFSHVIGPN